jgi:hypothetical protein
MKKNNDNWLSFNKDWFVNNSIKESRSLMLYLESTTWIKYSTCKRIRTGIRTSFAITKRWLWSYDSTSFNIYWSGFYSNWITRFQSKVMRFDKNHWMIDSAVFESYCLNFQVTSISTWFEIPVHCKKKRCFTEPQKKVSEISKSVQRGPKSQKTDEKIYETFF